MALRIRSHHPAPATPDPELDGSLDLIEQIHRALDQVIDPELGVPITDLGLIYGVEVDNGSVHVDLTTTTPICPLGEYLRMEAMAAIRRVDGVVSVAIDLVRTPLWTPDLMSDRARRALGWPAT